MSRIDPSFHHPSPSAEAHPVSNRLLNASLSTHQANGVIVTCNAKLSRNLTQLGQLGSQVVIAWRRNGPVNQPPPPTSLHPSKYSPGPT